MLISIETQSMFNLASYDVLNPSNYRINTRLMVEFFILYYVANATTHTLDIFVEGGRVVHSQIRKSVWCDEIMLTDEELTLFGIKVHRVNILCRDGKKLGVAGSTFDIDMLRGYYVLKPVTTLDRGVWYRVESGGREVKLTADIISGTQSPISCIDPSMEIRQIDSNTYRIYVPFEYYYARDPYSKLRIRIACTVGNDTGIIDANLMFTRNITVRCEDKYLTRSE